MIVDIFIRTYYKDIRWLSYALQSIHARCKGFRDIIICIPQDQRYLLNHLTAEKIITCPNFVNDYLGQQISKLQAFSSTDADAIMFTDSDCIFLYDMKPEDLMINNKPIILKTNYSKVGEAICWKAPTEKALGIAVEDEFMRRHPSLYYREDLKDAYEFLGNQNGSSGQRYILNQKSFSEFNYLGAYLWNHKRNKYEFIDTNIETIDTSKENHDAIHQQFVKQYWSHGIGEKEVLEIENLLK